MNKLLYVIIVSLIIGYIWGALVSDSGAQAEYRKTIYDLQQDKTNLLQVVNTCEDKYNLLKYGELSKAPKTENGW